ncbi:MAG TPA: hypothetical protein VN698_01915 [Bacteroidia bacterium]|nr:hypothetical protein [Bacteroidia bacterium]
MKYKSLTIILVTIIFLQACNNEQTVQAIFSPNSSRFITVLDPQASIPINQYNNTKGYWDDGKLITDFDCPDSRTFAPIDIKQWNKVPVVNGRLPTYEETQNGTAIHHYGEKQNPNVKPYNITLPKLATYYSRFTKKDELVIVIQIIQTATDTVVSYRYPTGGCGGSTFSKFHFLSDEEVRKATQ